MNTSNKITPAIKRQRELHDIAWRALDQALKLDEQKKHNIAIQKYREGLIALDEAIRLSFSKEEWKIAKQLHDKMKKNYTMFTERLRELMNKTPMQQMQQTKQIQQTQPTTKIQYVSQPSVRQKGTSSFFNKLFNFFFVDEELSQTTATSKSPQNQFQQARFPVQQNVAYKPSTKNPVTSGNTQKKVFQPVAHKPVKGITQRVTMQSNVGKRKTGNNVRKSDKSSKIRNWQDAPELRGVEKKMLEHILNEVMEQKHLISWDDIAGLVEAKQTLYEAVILPSLRPEIFTGLRAPARGVLLFGPPGNGKTMLAKAIASQSNATFFSISASSIVSKWHGEGEKLVRALFSAARYLQPAVIFIDEVDSILSSRSSGEHDATRRMKTEFLVQMDGVSGNGDERVLVLAATNRPHELDDAILRRFPKRVYIPLPDKSARLALIKHLLKDQKVKLTDKEYDAIANATQGFSGSDLKELCKETALIPIRELGNDILKVKASEVRALMFQDFKESIKHVRPSASHEIITELEKWNQKFGSFSSS